ncbi:HpcH/HpaI aldolase/citrate lyase family protein [Spiroplasma attinicola]|uniref:HpcH/HpaI aldolase/citrate lyase family protein n=1 Tax=Spiroplasma attinicola TaxID=2904537 RepID=UPI002022A0D3|nr:CoA ester lyase [Spiroplasma sp. JKS002670]MCL8210078.1 Citrate lyase subunit beta [Spiroplasma sp. JKS002670]
MLKKRRSALFVPGNNPGMFKDVIAYHPDIVIFDLEDAISPKEKDAARELTKRMLNFFNYQEYNIETAVRINHFDTEFYYQDLKAIVNSNVDIIRLPKVETKTEVLKCIADIEMIEKSINRTKPVLLFCAIESAKGVLNAYEIASADKRVVAIALGGFDYVLDLNATKSSDRKELLFGRNMVLHAARAAKIDAFDSVFGDINDLAGLKKETEFIKELGFTGKSAIHPNQVPIINQIFTPNEKEIADALAIITAYQKHQKTNKGVFTVNGKMVDKPIIEKAEKLLLLAEIKI